MYAGKVYREYAVGFNYEGMKHNVLRFKTPYPPDCEPRKQKIANGHSTGHLSLIGPARGNTETDQSSSGSRAARERGHDGCGCLLGLLV